MPLFTREYDAFGSTQDYVREVLALALQQRFTTHLEIETYTWDVLPPGLKMDLGESIAREYEWVLQALGQPTASRPPTPGSAHDAHCRPQRRRPDARHPERRDAAAGALGRPAQRWRASVRRFPPSPARRNPTT